MLLAHLAYSVPNPPQFLDDDFGEESTPTLLQLAQVPRCHLRKWFEEAERPSEILTEKFGRQCANNVTEILRIGDQVLAII